MVQLAIGSVLVKRRAAAVALGALLVATPGAARAEPILALANANVLLTFDSATPGSTSAVAISGVGSEQIVGIDFRPATTQLYGLGSSSNLYLINSLTGNAILVGPLGTPLGGTSYGVDFNPTVDRLRVTSDTDQNLRINPAAPGGAGTIADSPLAYAAADANAGTNPSVGGSAYTNNIPGAITTTLYGIDVGLNTLVMQNPANAGTLLTIGALGFDAPELLGFDISGMSGTAYAAWATAGGPSLLYTVNLTSGAAAAVGPIGTGPGQQVIGLAAPTPVPEPSSMALLGMGMLAAMRRLRRKRAL